MSVTTFNCDAKMTATLEALKAHYGAASKAEVFRKAVALLKVAQENERPDGSIVLVDRSRGKEVVVVLC
jgi:hypothetical protein